MKKIFAAMFLALIFATAPVQAQTNFDFNQNFNEKIQPLSYIYGGRVVGIKTFLSIREQPNENSREVMRIPNGAELSLRFTGNQNWWQVLSVTFNGQTYRNSYDPADGIGWISARYVQTY